MIYCWYCRYGFRWVFIWSLIVSACILWHITNGINSLKSLIYLCIIYILELIMLYDRIPFFVWAINANRICYLKCALWLYGSYALVFSIYDMGYKCNRTDAYNYTEQLLIHGVV